MSRRRDDITRSVLRLLADMLDGLEAGKSSLSAWLDKGMRKSDQPMPAKISALFRAARAVVGDAKASTAERTAALRVIGRQPDLWDQDRELLKRLLVPQVEETLQTAAAQSLSKIIDPRTPVELLKPWKSYSPADRKSTRLNSSHVSISYA